DLDLEADLGIDTVKQAETFAAVREKFDIPRVENLKLRDFATLGRVVEFVYTYRPDLRATTDGRRPATEEIQPMVVSPVPEAVVSAPSPLADPVAEKVLAIVAEKT